MLPTLVLIACLSPLQEVHALVRPRSAQKPAIVALQERGVQIRKGDLKGPEESLADVLTGIDVVISCVGPSEQQDQIPLAKAAKNAGVQRFVPCGFITVAPPGGIMWLRDEVCWLAHPNLTFSINLPHRKRRSTTTSSSSDYPTLSSMSAGGTSSPTPALSLVASIMP